MSHMPPPLWPVQDVEKLASKKGVVTQTIKEVLQVRRELTVQHSLKTLPPPAATRIEHQAVQPQCCAEQPAYTRHLQVQVSGEAAGLAQPGHVAMRMLLACVLCPCRAWWMTGWCTRRRSAAQTTFGEHIAMQQTGPCLREGHGSTTHCYPPGSRHAPVSCCRSFPAEQSTKVCCGTAAHASCTAGECGNTHSAASSQTDCRRLRSQLAHARNSGRPSVQHWVACTTLGM